MFDNVDTSWISDVLDILTYFTVRIAACPFCVIAINNALILLLLS
jgi:hypothetical protein